MKQIKSVSIVMAIYNERESYLEESIDSILKQTYVDFEFIIINDNPSRNLNRIILERYENLDERIKVIHNKKNVGLAQSLNKGIEAAIYDYIVRMDADDISASDRLEKQLTHMFQNKIDFLFSEYDVIDENGKLLDKKIGYYDEKYIERNLKYDNLLHHPTVIFKKDVFIKVGMYNCFPIAQDYDLWLRVQKNGSKIIIIEESLLKYRVQQNSITSRKRMQQAYTTLYIRKNYMKEFDYNKYNNFLNENSVFDKRAQDKFQSDFEKFHRLKEQTQIKKIIGLLYLFLFQKYYRIRLAETIIKKIKAGKERGQK